MDRTFGIATLYFTWHYGRGLRGLFGIAQNYVLFAIHLFSIPILLDTLFEPWKQIEIPPTGPWFTQEQLTAIWTNIISRTLGMIVRTLTIIIGGVFVLFIIALAVLFLLLWLALPVIPLIALFLGLRLFTL